MHRRHQEAGRNPLAGDVGHHQADAPPGQRQNVVVVASHFPARQALGRNVKARYRRPSPWKECLLDLPRELQLAVLSLLLGLDPVEDDTFEGGKRLPAEAHHEVGVLVAKRCSGDPRTSSHETEATPTELQTKDVRKTPHQQRIAQGADRQVLRGNGSIGQRLSDGIPLLTRHSHGGRAGTSFVRQDESSRLLEP